jgi:hypothetical protein
MSEQENGQSGRGNKPVEILRDGALKISIFRNRGEQGDSYSMVPGRIYTDKETGQVHETNSFSGNEALRMAYLMTKGHERVMHHRTQDRDREKQQQAPEQQRGTRQRSTRDHGDRER